MKNHKEHNVKNHDMDSHDIEPKNIDTHEWHSWGFHWMEVNARILKITGWLTGVYFVIELWLWFYTGSVAVISDAFHTFSAVWGILIAFIANKLAARSANTSSTFWLKRAEIMWALLNGVFLFLMALYVLYMWYNRLWMDVELPTWIMLLAAAWGLITEIISFKLIFKSQKENINMQWAFWHIMQTFVWSILIIIAAVIIRITGYTPIDAILWMTFWLVLIWASYKIIKDSLDILMQNTPKDVDILSVKNDLLKIDWIIWIRHMHAWVLTSNKNIFSAHIQVKNHDNAEKILKQSEKILKQNHNIYFTTLQLEKTHTSLKAEEINAKI